MINFNKIPEIVLKPTVLPGIGIRLAFLLLSLIFCLSSYTPLHAQSWSYARYIGGNANDNNGVVDVDSLGNIYMYGHFSKELAIDDSIIDGLYGSANFHYQNIYLAKLDSNHNLLWVRVVSMTKPGDDLRNGPIGLDKFGNVYVSGFAGGDTLDMEDTLLIENSPDREQRAFIAKYATNGDFLWAKQIRQTGVVGITEINGLHPSNNAIYVAGRFANELILDDTTASGFSPTDQVIFFNKYDLDGNRLWTRFIIQNGSLGRTKSDIDTSGNLYANVPFFDNTSLGFVNNSFTYTPDSTGGNFVIKYTPDGGILWAYQIRGYPTCDGISYFDNKIFYIGKFERKVIVNNDTVVTQSIDDEDVCLILIDSDGNPKWAKQMGDGTDNSIEFKDIHVNQQGFIYATGVGISPASFGDTTVPAGTGNVQDAYVVKFDSLGNTILVKWMGGNGVSNENGTHVKNRGDKVYYWGFTDSPDWFSMDGHYPATIAELVTPKKFSLTTQLYAEMDDCNAVITPSGGQLTATSGSSYKWYYNDTVITGATAAMYDASVTGWYRAEVTFADGCKAKTHPVYYEEPSGLEEANLAASLLLYPNPAQNITTLVIDHAAIAGPLELHLMDRLGRSVKTWSVTKTNNWQEFALPLEDVNAGLYILNVNSEKYSVNKKLIIK